MGNCLTPVLSNIYMEFYEIRLSRAVILDDTFWARYVMTRDRKLGTKKRLK